MAAQLRAPGSLVHARARDWVVLPSSDDNVLRLRPLTAAHEGEVGLYLPLEANQVREAQFPPPDPARGGDALGAATLFDAARLSLRSGAAPFRALGHISVVPRPYQFVPLLMALRQERVRLLIADDVGVGKTIEAGLIAREMLDRGIARRLGVLAPAHLCDQWQREFTEKFQLNPALIQPATLGRLERAMPRQDVSVYEHYRHLVASIDFVKAAPHRLMFEQSAPDLIIVDEAHMVARPAGADPRTQQRHDLIKSLAADESRHILLVTATPHSGMEESFRSLLGLLDERFDTAPDKRLDKKALVPFIIQRRRSDVTNWLGADTPFPERRPEERTYQLSPAYSRLYENVLDYFQSALARARDATEARSRVRHWAALAVLRSLLSSPAAAQSVLENRATALGGRDEDETPEADAGESPADSAFGRQILDGAIEEEAPDSVPTAPLDDPAGGWTQHERRRLRSFKEEAARLAGQDQDAKLARLLDTVDELISEDRNAIVFCRFIQTAHYARDQIAAHLGARCAVEAVTGELADEQRRERVAALAGYTPRVLVATDCLSEGINLQEHFDAVVHYDLPWNPNKLEQREGRIDRYGQPRKTIRTILLYGTNNEVDLVVLDVLLRKAGRIRKSLGISVPVPGQSDEVLTTLLESVLLRREGRNRQLNLSLETPERSRLHEAWDAAAEREREDRAFFRQEGIQPAEVAREVQATDDVLGDTDAVRRFLADALQRFNGSLRETRDGIMLEPGDLADKLRPHIKQAPARITFDRQQDQDALYIGRTHPVVEAVCDSVLSIAFRPEGADARLSGRFARAGAMLTDAVDRRTVLLLLRFRYRIIDAAEEFAEEVRLFALRRGGQGPDWLKPFDTAGREFARRAAPKGNLPPAEREEQVKWALDYLDQMPGWWKPLKDWRVEELQAAHSRLRGLIGRGEAEIHAYAPDIMGVFVLVPA